MHLLDLRNHGNSPHTEEMDYDLMVEDVAKYISDKQLEKATLVGHSMGGKVAMKIALSNPELVSKLVVVDIAPVSYSLKWDSEFQVLITAMKSMDTVRCKSRNDAADEMSKYVQDPFIRHFLLTNLVADDAGRYYWRLNLETIDKSLSTLRMFPVETTARFEGETVFVVGNHSNYVKKEYEPTILEYFPNSRVERVDAGHWVHSERPERVAATIIELLRRNS